MSAHSRVVNRAAKTDKSDTRISLFARRKLHRLRIDGLATVFELSGEYFGRMHTLMRIDYSDEGVNGITDAAIAQGTSITIGFQASDCTAHLGRIVSCTHSENGYRIGVAFNEPTNVRALL
jgi:hypothetical protein